jgi:hypothetical protein
LGYLFNDKLKNQLCFSFEFLSGDDAGSNSDEMFDVLWGRWARWGDIGLYSFAPETRVAQMANVCRLGPGWGCAPMKNMDLIVNYYALLSPQPVPTRESSPTLFSNDGNFRGHLLQALLKHRFNSRLCGHLWGECLFPGDYYVHSHPMPFLRAELIMTF